MYPPAVPPKFRSHVSNDGTVVTLDERDMTSLPEWLASLTNLAELNLASNTLAELPNWLGNLTSLTRLNLSGNQLTELPGSLRNLTNLAVLNLDGNGLVRLPDWLGNLTNLAVLDLSSTGLTKLPDSLQNLTNLTELHLSSNRLVRLPDWLGNLTNLAELNLSSTGLTKLPDSLQNLTNLTELHLGGNGLVRLPDWLGNLTNLQTLYIYGNQLTELPDSLADLVNLTQLSLSQNRLTLLPEWLGNLTNLRDLYLYRNQLTELPDSLGNLTKLEDFYLYGNLLTELPDWFGNLTVLTRASLNQNRLTKLPESMRNLTSLTRLYINKNQLTKLPEWLGDLTSLTELDLEDNELTELPGSLANLTNLNYLKLAKNPLRDPIPQIVQRGMSALLTYLRSLRDAQPQYEAKLLLVGEGNVGKTSLIAALRGAPFIEGRPTTHGIEVWPLAVHHPTRDVEIILRAWDFGGQEVYRITHQFFFSHRALYIVVWNARQGHEQDEVETWLRRIQLRVGPDAYAIVVATHCAERAPELDYPHLKDAFPDMLAGSFEVDSRTGEGIEQLRAGITKHAARLPQMGQLMSPRWESAREEILARAKDEPQIHYEEFAEICMRHDLIDSEAVTLAQLMHDLGQIIHYGEDDGLKDIVVLNPEWLTKAISYVLEDRPTRETGGILNHARLQTIWGGHPNRSAYPVRYYRYFLRLMEKFDVSYRLEGDESRSLIAQLVSHERPELPWRQTTQLARGIRRLAMVCRLSDMAPGLIPWLTVRHHGASTGLHWRRGVFLRHPIAAYESEALLELRRSNELTMEVRAPSPDLYFNVLRDSIEDLIRRRWPGLTYQLFIPCPSNAFSASRCPGLLALDGLLRLREHGHSDYPCIECAQVHEISQLLTGFTAPDRPLAVELAQMHEQLTEIKSSVDRVAGYAAETAETMRRVLRAVGTEITDCPRLFTLTSVRPATSRRLRFYQHHCQLTLWCEHPGYWHPWTPASYQLDPPKEWFIQISPYMTLIFKTLQLVVPLTGSFAIASLPTDQLERASAHLEMMRTLMDDLPTKTMQNLDQSVLGETTGQLTAAEGEALRALRKLLFEHDRLQAFGGMRRVQAPSGDFLWVCPDHYSEYDPGLPVIP